MQKLYLKEGLGAYGEVTLCLMICVPESKRRGHPSVLGSPFCRRYASSKTTSVLMFFPRTIHSSYCTVHHCSFPEQQNPAFNLQRLFENQV